MGTLTAAEVFSKDTYDTPEHTRRYIWDRLLLGSRWVCYYHFFGVVLRSRSQAIKGQYDLGAWANECFKIFRAVEGCGGRFHLRGLDNLRKYPEPMVIVSNHMSTMETGVFPCIILPSRPISFVVKKALVEGPVFGPLMSRLDPIAVGRTNPREDFRVVMERGTEILKKGKSVVVFPESTRTRHFTPKKFNTLGVKLAQKAGVGIIPVAIKTNFWGESKWIKGFGPLNRNVPIHMTFGEPIPRIDNPREDHQRVVDFIASHLQEWERDERD